MLINWNMFIVLGNYIEVWSVNIVLFLFPILIQIKADFLVCFGERNSEVCLSNQMQHVAESTFMLDWFSCPCRLHFKKTYNFGSPFLSQYPLQLQNSFFSRSLGTLPELPPCNKVEQHRILVVIAIYVRVIWTYIIHNHPWYHNLNIQMLIS